VCWSVATITVCAIHEDAVQPSITPTSCPTCFQSVEAKWSREFSECVLGSFLPVTEQVLHKYLHLSLILVCSSIKKIPGIW
jgi:hypothetical protein